MKLGFAALAACCGMAMLLAVNGQTLSGLPSLDYAPPGYTSGQKSVSFIDLGMPGSGAAYELSATDPLVAPPAGLTPNTPDQIHVTLGEATDSGASVWVSWATGTESFVTNPQAPAYPSNFYKPQFADPAKTVSIVQYSLTSGGPYLSVSGYARSYIQTYIHDGNTYVSNLFHHVHVTGLPYGQPVYYKCGDPATVLSKEFTLSLPTSLRPKTPTYPLRLGIVADIGQTQNSSVTYQHLVANKPDTVLFIGDLSYADNYNDKGGDTQITPTVPPTNNVLYANTTKTLAQTYQPRWNTMNRLLQNAGNGAQLTYSFLPGNHEIERDEFLRPFQGYTNRYRHSYEASYSQDPLFYSNDIGPVHVIMLNAYDGYLPNNTLDVTVNGVSQVLFGNSGGPAFPTGNYPQSTLGAEQFSWFLNDLARVNRAVTPWVIVGWHQPPYNSYSVHYKEAECLRQMVEPFLYNYGVDIVVHGHIHAYERTFQVLNYKLDGCAPRWLTMGDGGNQEGLYKTFASAPNTNCYQAGACSSVTPSAAPQFCATLQNGYYAPPNGTQPNYSAYREPSFGHGILTIFNSTVAQWQWFRNQDNLPVVSDSQYFVRNPKCNNFSPGTPLPVESTAPPATTAEPAKVNPIKAVIDADKAIKGQLADAIFG
ncbi:Purple acid phosphatase 15 [Coccomyxa sp. Obi]|nr:Purple acid phosphatase 15 [Coccomyxa sp. Obi]